MNDDKKDLPALPDAHWSSNIGACYTTEQMLAYARAALDAAALAAPILPVAGEGGASAEEYSDMIRAIAFEYSAGGYNSEGLLSIKAADDKLRWIIAEERRAAIAQRAPQESADMCLLLDELLASWLTRENSPELAQRRINARSAIESAFTVQRAPVEAKPVGRVTWCRHNHHNDAAWLTEEDLPDGTLLYTAPVAPVEAPACQRNCPIDTPYGPATCYECTEAELAGVSVRDAALEEAAQCLEGAIYLVTIKEHAARIRALRSQPAPVAPNTDAMMDRQYLAGYDAGFMAGEAGDDAKRAAVHAGRAKAIREADASAPVAQESGELAKKVLEEAIAVCRAERVEETGEDGDSAYNAAIDHCIEGIMALQLRASRPAAQASQSAGGRDA